MLAPLAGRIYYDAPQQDAVPLDSEPAFVKFTIETNGLILLEAGTAEGSALKDLVTNGPAGGHVVRMPAISASELQKGGSYLLDFSMFLNRIEAAGLGKGDLLKPLAYWGVAFWDNAVYTSDEAEKLESAIHAVLFPGEPMSCPEGLGDEFKSGAPHPDYVKWRNRKCDVLAMWCHIFYDGDIFVTADENFHKQSKKRALIALGAKATIRPSDLSSVLAPAV